MGAQVRGNERVVAGMALQQLNLRHRNQALDVVNEGEAVNGVGAFLERALEANLGGRVERRVLAFQSGGEGQKRRVSEGLDEEE